MPAHIERVGRAKTDKQAERSSGTAPPVASTTSFSFCEIRLSESMSHHIQD